MVLETGGEAAKFKPRTIEGVELAIPVQPSKLILDGQQRLTSLFASLMSGKPVPTCTRRQGHAHRASLLPRMAGCLDPDGDREDAIRSLPPTRILTSDFGRTVELDVSTTEKDTTLGSFLCRCLRQCQVRALEEWFSAPPQIRARASGGPESLRDGRVATVPTIQGAAD